MTDDIKKKLNLENVKLKTTIEEENYRICKEILMEKSCKPESSLYEIDNLLREGHNLQVTFST